ncbi:MAG: DUF6378 domain-containing protein [Undibacterium sp.]
MSLNKTLKERGARYGNFATQSEIVQGLKSAMYSSKNWPSLENDMKEALEMVVSKIGRILNGDPRYKDSWTDIAGYASLIEKTLK